MMGSSREGYQTKQERDATINMEKISKASSSTSTRQWSAFRNPRIVRVSRSFGGKDRHSKVCTIRGLRDRRIRLSVPTAIQLYDLQDKLGLNQPSKVIDWLLEATKFDIEKLPPLQFPHGFSQFQFHQTLFPIPSATATTTSTSTVTPSFFDGGGFQVQNLMATKSRNIWDLDSEIGRVKGKWVKSNEEEDGGSGSGGYNNNNNLHDFVSTQKLFQSHPLLPCFPNSNNNAMSSNNLSLSQFGLFPSQVDPNLSNANSMQFPSSNSFPLLASGNSQLLFGPPSSDSLFTTRYAPLDNNDPRAQVNQIKFLNSASQHYPLIHSFNSTVRPFPAPFNWKLLDSDNNNLSQEDRDSTRNS